MSHHPDAEIAVRVRRLEERVVAAGLTDDAELEAILVRTLQGANPRNGARIVARAWVDDGFRARLLADAGEAVTDVGLDMRSGLKVQNLGVVENTETEHHVLVCTLCSCYPIGLLGPSPTWYKSEAYRSRVVREPRAVLAEFGLELGDDVEITVHDTSAENRYLVLPRRPAGTDGLTEEQLAGLVTRDGLIGTAAV